MGLFSRLFGPKGRGTDPPAADPAAGAPFTTFRGFLKRHAQEALDDRGRELFDFLFPRFGDDNGAGRAHDPWAAHPLAVALGSLVQFLPADTRYRRFAGANFPRSRYFAVCADAAGDDRQTMVHELRAYRDPARSGMVEIIDLAGGCRLQSGGSVHTLPARRATVVLVHGFDRVPPHLRSLPFECIPGPGGEPLHTFLFPYVVEERAVERVIDLRLPHVRDWFYRTFRTPPTAPPGVPADHTTAYSRFHFSGEKPPVPESFAGMLPTLLNPDIGGGGFAGPGSVLYHVAHELRQRGCGGLVFPSARADATVLFEGGTMTGFWGWNFVWYDGAPVFDGNVDLTTHVTDPWAWVRLPLGVTLALAPPGSPNAGGLAVRGMVDHWSDDYRGQVDALKAARAAFGPVSGAGAPPEWAAFTLGALLHRWVFFLAAGADADDVHRAVLELVGLSLPCGGYFAAGRVLELWYGVRTTGEAEPEVLDLACRELAGRLGRTLAKAHDWPELGALVQLGSALESFRANVLVCWRRGDAAGPLPAPPPRDIAWCPAMSLETAVLVNRYLTRFPTVESIPSDRAEDVLMEGSVVIETCRRQLRDNPAPTRRS